MSLRARLLLAVGAVALVALIVADLATYSALRSFLIGRLDQTLAAAQAPLAAALERGAPLSVPVVERLAPGMFVELRDPSGLLLGPEIGAVSPGGQPLAPALPARISIPSPAAVGAPQVFFSAGPADSGSPRFRVVASQLIGGDQLILATPLSPTTSTLHRLLLVELAVTGAALAGAAALGGWLVRVGLRPLEEMEEAAAAIAAGDMGRRVPGESASTEVGRLAAALNTMLSHIHQLFAARDATEAELRRSEERLRRFVADASHELRTPLAAVSAYAELFERGAGSRPADLQRVLAGIRSETGRMSELVEDLLLLARLDEGRPLRSEPVELVGLAAQAVETAVTTAPEWPASVEASSPVEVTGDPARLRQVLDNLLSNVRHHTPAGTRAVVRVGQSDGEAVLEVADAGPGLGDDHRVFERFYRADASRSRRHGGAGLGLAIVAAIVGAHGGRVSAEETPGGGATFKVVLPAAGATDPDPAGAPYG